MSRSVNAGYPVPASGTSILPPPQPAGRQVAPAIFDDRGMPARWFWGAVAALLLLHLVLAWLARTGGIATGQDDAIYLFLARSLRAFGYHDLYVVDHPPHNLYPPGYPAILAILTSVVGERIAVLQAFGIAASAAALGIGAAVVRRLWSSRVALLFLAAVVINTHLVGTAGKIGSDASYLLFSLIALGLLARSNPSSRHLVLAGAAAIVAALTRSVGVTLLAAVALHWLLERRYLATALFTTASAATVGAWLLWIFVAPEQYVGRNYVADATYVPASSGNSSLAGVLLERALTNLPLTFGDHVPNRVGIPSLPGPGALDLVVAAMVGVALLAGLVVLWRRWQVVALYLLAYGAMLAVWPWVIGRFLNVVIPLLTLAVLLGVGALAGRVRPGWRVPALAAMALSLVLFGAVRSAKLVEERSACTWGRQLPPAECRQGEQGAFFSALEYLDRQAPPGVVVVSGKPASVHYFTGRYTLPRDRVAAQPPEGLVEYLNRENALYVILGRLHVTEYYGLAPRLEANCASLALEASFDRHTHVLRVLEPGAVAADGEACRVLAEYRSQPFRGAAE